MQGNIINITRFCVDDGPGIRTTVFLKGCPLKCIWCHNPESQKGDIENYVNGEVIGRKADVQEIINEVIKDKIFYETSGGGVTVSGGEPLMQPEFTAKILEGCKEKGISTAIETSGYGTSDALYKILKYCDLVLFDIKETNEENHLKFTGVKQDIILKNLKIINEMKIPFIIRMPIIPGLNDRSEHFIKVKQLSETFEYCKDIEIMPYHKLGKYKYEKLDREYLCKDIEEPSKAQVEKWQNSIK